MQAINREPAPVTTVTKGSILELALQAGDDLSQVKVYITMSRHAFESIHAEFDGAFNAATMSGVLSLYAYQNADTYCADKVKISDLF